MEPKHLTDPHQIEEQSLPPAFPSANPPEDHCPLDNSKTYIIRASATYERYRAELEREYPGQTALIRGDELIDIFQDFNAAVDEGVRRFGLENFMAYEIGDPKYEISTLDSARANFPCEPYPAEDAETYFAQELATYERYRVELERDHMGQAALLRGDELIGVFKDFNAAVDEGFRRFGLEKFMVQEIGDTGFEIPVLG